MVLFRQSTSAPRIRKEVTRHAGAEREMLATSTDLLLGHEGVDPSNERARLLAWVFVQRC
jgi:hypothetical protein